MSPLNRHTPFQILLAVDHSEHTWAAVQLLCCLPLPPGSQVIAASVVAPGQKSDREGLSAVLSEIQLRLRDKVRTTTVCLSGPPAQALMEAARTHRANLIVLGAAGLRKVLGLLLDGVAQQVVEAADRPVLVVRSPCRGLRLAGKPQTSFLACGDAVTEVMKYSQVQAVDLIVTGSRGLGKVEGWLRGSLSRRLIHSAHCSVLVIRDHIHLEKL